MRNASKTHKKESTKIRVTVGHRFFRVIRSNPNTVLVLEQVVYIWYQQLVSQLTPQEKGFALGESEKCI